MTPIEAVAKAIAIANWHNDPERPFTDAVWERELRWWRDPDNQIIKESFFADRCFRQARAALLALAEAELPLDSIAAGIHAPITDDENLKVSVGCMMENASDDPGLYVACGLSEPSENPIVRQGDEFDFKAHVLLMGFRAMCRAIAEDRP